MVIEPYGFEGADQVLLESLSRGTEALSVLRHDYASPRVCYAVDGITVAAFDPGDRLCADPYEPGSAELVAAAEGASPQRQRAVATAEVARLAAMLGLDGTPGLAEALDGAARGAAPHVAADSPLGRHVRDWLTVQKRAGESLNGPYRSRLSDAERTQGNRYGWFVAALRGALEPEPDKALLAALRPVGSVPSLFGGPAARAAILRTLSETN
ncbi:hypothetical protein [Actinoplanes sp. NPDC049118]|uniref:hypothetical protein n=1 Tax=Actinoplanes sp. NPDC049118 TaxID=3155769 RepID=UPI00340A7620